MALKNGCCAVSKNSSFFIYDLPSGYIPCDALFVSNRYCPTRSVPPAQHLVQRTVAGRHRARFALLCRMGCIRYSTCAPTAAITVSSKHCELNDRSRAAAKPSRHAKVQCIHFVHPCRGVNARIFSSDRLATALNIPKKVCCRSTPLQHSVNIVATALNPNRLARPHCGHSAAATVRPVYSQCHTLW